MTEVSREEALRLLKRGTRGKRRGRAQPTGPLELEHLELFIPGMLTTSLNVGLRQHIGQKHAAKEQWVPVLAPVLLLLASAAAREHHWELKIMRFGTRLLDYVNLVGSCKALEDVIKETGIIHDDAPQFLTLVVDQMVVPPELRPQAIGTGIKLIRGGRLHEKTIATAADHTSDQDQGA